MGKQILDVKDNVDNINQVELLVTEFDELGLRLERLFFNKTLPTAEQSCLVDLYSQVEAAVMERNDTYILEEKRYFVDNFKILLSEHEARH